MAFGNFDEWFRQKLGGNAAPAGPAQMSPSPSGVPMLAGRPVTDYPPQMIAELIKGLSTGGNAPSGPQMPPPQPRVPSLAEHAGAPVSVANFNATFNENFNRDFNNNFNANYRPPELGYDAGLPVSGPAVPASVDTSGDQLFPIPGQSGGSQVIGGDMLADPVFQRLVEMGATPLEAKLAIDIVGPMDDPNKQFIAAYNKWLTAKTGHYQDTAIPPDGVIGDVADAVGGIPAGVYGAVVDHVHDPLSTPGDLYQGAKDVGSAVGHGLAWPQQQVNLIAAKNAYNVAKRKQEGKGIFSLGGLKEAAITALTEPFGEITSVANMSINEWMDKNPELVIAYTENGYTPHKMVWSPTGEQVSQPTGETIPAGPEAVLAAFADHHNFVQNFGQAMSNDPTWAAGAFGKVGKAAEAFRAGKRALTAEEIGAGFVRGADGVQRLLTPVEKATGLIEEAPGLLGRTLEGVVHGAGNVARAAETVVKLPEEVVFGGARAARGAIPDIPFIGGKADQALTFAGDKSAAAAAAAKQEARDLATRTLGKDSLFRKAVLRGDAVPGEAATAAADATDAAAAAGVPPPVADVPGEAAIGTVVETIPGRAEGFGAKITKQTDGTFSVIDEDGISVSGTKYKTIEEARAEANGFIASRVTAPTGPVGAADIPTSDIPTPAETVPTSAAPISTEPISTEPIITPPPETPLGSPVDAATGGTTGPIVPESGSPTDVLQSKTVPSLADPTKVADHLLPKSGGGRAVDVMPSHTEEIQRAFFEGPDGYNDLAYEHMARRNALDAQQSSIASGGERLENRAAKVNEEMDFKRKSDAIYERATGQPAPAFKPRYRETPPGVFRADGSIDQGGLNTYWDQLKEQQHYSGESKAQARRLRKDLDPMNAIFERALGPDEAMANTVIDAISRIPDDEAQTLGWQLRQWRGETDAGLTAEVKPVAPPSEPVGLAPVDNGNLGTPLETAPIVPEAPVGDEFAIAGVPASDSIMSQGKRVIEAGKGPNDEVWIRGKDGRVREVGTDRIVPQSELRTPEGQARISDQPDDVVREWMNPSAPLEEASIPPTAPKKLVWEGNAPVVRMRGTQGREVIIERVTESKGGNLASRERSKWRARYLDGTVENGVPKSYAIGEGSLAELKKGGQAHLQKLEDLHAPPISEAAPTNIPESPVASAAEAAPTSAFPTTSEAPKPEVAAPPSKFKGTIAGRPPRDANVASIEESVVGHPNAGEFSQVVTPLKDAADAELQAIEGRIASSTGRERWFAQADKFANEVQLDHDAADLLHQMTNGERAAPPYQFTTPDVPDSLIPGRGPHAEWDARIREWGERVKAGDVQSEAELQSVIERALGPDNAVARQMRQVLHRADGTAANRELSALGDELGRMRENLWPHKTNPAQEFADSIEKGHPFHAMQDIERDIADGKVISSVTDSRPAQFRSGYEFDVEFTDGTKRTVFDKNKGMPTKTKPASALEAERQKVLGMQSGEPAVADVSRETVTAADGGLASAVPAEPRPVVDVAPTTEPPIVEVPPVTEPAADLYTPNPMTVRDRTVIADLRLREVWNAGVAADSEENAVRAMQDAATERFGARRTKPGERLNRAGNLQAGQPEVYLGTHGNMWKQADAQIAEARNLWAEAKPIPRPPAVVDTPIGAATDVPRVTGTTPAVPGDPAASVEPLTPAGAAPPTYRPGDRLTQRLEYTPPTEPSTTLLPPEPKPPVDPANEPAVWPSQPTKATSKNDPFPGLWQEAKKKPTLEEGVKVFEDHAEASIGSRKSAIKGTSQAKKWSQNDERVKKFMQDWTDTRGGSTNPHIDGIAPAEEAAAEAARLAGIPTYGGLTAEDLLERLRVENRITPQMHADLSEVVSTGGTWKTVDGVKVLDGAEEKTVWQLFLDNISEGMTVDEARMAIEKQLSPSLPTGRRSKILGLLPRAAKAITVFNREHRMFGTTKGPVGILTDFVGDDLTAITSGRPLTAVESFKLNWARKIFRATRDKTSVAEALGNTEIAISMEKSGMIAPEFGKMATRAEVEVSDEMAVHRFVEGIARKFGVSEGIAHKFGQATGFLASERIRDVREAMDITRRWSTFGQAAFEGFAKKSKALREYALSRGDALPEAESIFKRLAEESPKGDFSADDITRIGEELGANAGQVEHIARRWRTALHEIRAEGIAEQSRVHFDFSATNADAALKKAFLFHTWQMRAAPLYLQNALRNPVLMSAYAHIADDLHADCQKRQGHQCGYLELWSTATGQVAFMQPGYLLSSAFINLEPDWANPNATKIDKLLRTVPASVTPVLQGVLSGFGYSSVSAPDMFAMNNDGRVMGAIVNYGRAHGWFGDDKSHSLGPAFWDDWNNAFYGAVRDWTTQYAPASTDFPTTDSMKSEKEMIQARIRDLVYMDYDVPLATSRFDLKQKYPAAFDALYGEDGALIAWNLGKENEYADEAFQDFTSGNLSSLATLVVPGGVTVRSASQDELTNIKESAKAAGDTETALAAGDSLSAAREGSAMATSLDEGQTNVATAGTDADRAIMQGYNAIWFGDDATQYLTGIFPGVTNDQLQAMSRDDREQAANYWLSKQGVDAPAALQRARDAKNAAIAENPVDAAYRDWVGTARGDNPGDAAAWRENAIKVNPNYARFIEGYPAYLKAMEKAGNDHPLDLDSYGTTREAYMAWKGERSATYSPNPISTGDAALVDMIGSNGGGTGANAPKDPTTKLMNDITKYQTDVQIFNSYLQQYTNNPNATLDGMNPQLRQAVVWHLSQMGIDEPYMPSSVSEYLAWADAQKASGAPSDITTYTSWRANFDAKMQGMGLDSSTVFSSVLAGNNPFAGTALGAYAGSTSAPFSGTALGSYSGSPQVPYVGQ